MVLHKIRLCAEFNLSTQQYINGNFAITAVL